MFRCPKRRGPLSCSGTWSTSTGNDYRSARRHNISLYLIAGGEASTGAVATGVHLPSARTRRYPSDMDDVQWTLTAPLIPAGGTGRRGGRPPTHSRRDVVDGIRYVAPNRCVWLA